MTTLNRIREENATTDESKTYYSILRTGLRKLIIFFLIEFHSKFLLLPGQLIPYDSAIFLSTDTLPMDPMHQDSASMILLKKRIRVSKIRKLFELRLSYSNAFLKCAQKLFLIIFDEELFKLSENSSTAVRQTGFLGQLALR